MQVVLKVIERDKIDRERFREIALMKHLKHKHVVRMLEVIESPERLYIVSQFVEGGELYEYMMARHHLAGTSGLLALLFINVNHHRSISQKRKREFSGARLLSL